MGSKVLGVLGVSFLLLAGCFGSSRDDDEPSASGGDAGSSSSGGTAPVAGGGGGGKPGEAPDGGLPLPDGPPSAVDVLFVIDNSSSMSDKQLLLRDALPGLVQRLIAPNCIGASGGPAPSSGGECPAGMTLEFPPVRDLHLGIVTSSLGAHGGDACASPSGTTSTPDDKAHLLASLRGLPSWNDAGFLAWDPAGTANTPPGESDVTALVTQFQDHVEAAGESGCGFEATLEAFYRFLVDPEPPASVAVDPTTSVTVKSGIDATVLEQRAAFLRPDSLVYVVVLTDENDCSIRDDGQGFIVGRYQNQFRMPRATSACAADPNDRCCRSCAIAESTPPSGCAPLGSDPECAQGTDLSALEDSLNLRCWEQKRRFGFDLLYPIQRYVDGLTKLQIPKASGELVNNPLFAPAGGAPTRHPSRVILAGIVGVPWQDISTEASWTEPGLSFLSATELEEAGRWDVILGDPENGVPPSDPLMIEMPEPRTGTHPLLGFPMAPSTSVNPQENPINGHEGVLTDRDDLQFACIFPLSEPRDCSAALGACACVPELLDRNLPVCQPPGGGAASTTQYYAKAYPSLRPLSLLRALGRQAVVASVCPKVVDDPSDPSYGYGPVARALVDQTRELLSGR